MKILVLPTVVYVSNDSCKSYTLVFWGSKQVSSLVLCSLVKPLTLPQGLQENNTETLQRRSLTEEFFYYAKDALIASKALGFCPPLLMGKNEWGKQSSDV